VFASRSASAGKTPVKSLPGLFTLLDNGSLSPEVFSFPDFECSKDFVVNLRIEFFVIKIVIRFVPLVNRFFVSFVLFFVSFITGVNLVLIKVDWFRVGFGLNTPNKNNSKRVTVIFTDFRARLRLKGLFFLIILKSFFLKLANIITY